MATSSTRKKTSPIPTTPSAPPRCASVTMAPQPAKTSAKVPTASASARRPSASVTRSPVVRLTRADDRRRRVSVHAVAHAYLDVVETRGGQHRAELLFGEGAGDAAGVGGHVSPRVLVHVGVGGDVGDGEPPTRTQDASGFGDDPGLVAGEVDHA